MDLRPPVFVQVPTILGSVALLSHLTGYRYYWSSDRSVFGIFFVCMRAQQWGQHIAAEVVQMCCTCRQYLRHCDPGS